jgi:hypothetical protein
MIRIWERLASVSGSVGIAALAVAILMVPYSDLNAATSSAGNCVNSCTPAGQPGSCTCPAPGVCVANPPVTCSNCIPGSIFGQCICGCRAD